MLMIRK